MHTCGGKNTLAGVEQDPVGLYLFEEYPEVLLVLLRRAGVYQDVVNISEAKIEPLQDLVHETLKSLGIVSQAERH
jgi:hypothetical protein